MCARTGYKNARAPRQRQDDGFDHIAI